MDHKQNNLTKWPCREVSSSNYGIFQNYNNIRKKSIIVQEKISCLNNGSTDSQHLELEEDTYSKNEIKSTEKTFEDLSSQIEVLQKTTERNFKDVGDKQNEHHTEQMTEHQKTRDELLIDNGKLQETVNTLQEKVKNGWKEPRNWSIGFTISVMAGLVILAVQSFS